MIAYVIKTEIRFYEQNGWTPQLLSCYVTKGEMVSFGCDSTKDKKYWCLKNGSSIDTDRMVLDKTISTVIRFYNEEPGLTDIQLLRSRSWLA